ncbi:class I SAM-dependent methyltransferase [Butyrivibrio sp. XPD2002]|uniref:class I SAM-dependent methyltransferase n=1 Tax=Butyrivibrio sp. XPD2002 TaxID=1280665 RepID=UPI0004025987|nr:class I SAM-dependent methyltransferase [Butyrivibrio sp. XPD2002]
MKNIVLSERLGAVAGLVKSAASVCDIGTDHGFVPIYLINSGACKKALAMDINEGPLERADEHIREYGLQDKIETRLSNGMEKLQAGEAEAIVCAGMGGLLMKRILEDGRPREKGVKRMVLQPQSDLRLFREYLRRERFFIEDEAEIFEEGKYYVAMSVRVSDDDNNDLYDRAIRELGDVSEADAIRICDRFGPSLILKKDETLKKYLAHEKEILEGILLKLSENEHTERMHDIMDKINDITIVLSM